MYFVLPAFFGGVWSGVVMVPTFIQLFLFWWCLFSPCDERAPPEFIDTDFWPHHYNHTTLFSSFKAVAITFKRERAKEYTHCTIIGSSVLMMIITKTFTTQ